MEKQQTILNKILLIVLVSIIAVMTAISGIFTRSVYADTDIDVVAAFEKQDAMVDLQNSTIGGNAFNIDDYPYRADGKPQIISFVEFGYSLYADKQSDFGLYVYVYNPQDKAIDTNTERNRIQFTYGNNAAYLKPTLKFLNYSKQVGYEGRFYKFRIMLTYDEREQLLNNVAKHGRVYQIIGIELSYKGVVTDYKHAQTYTYSGYAKGYGSELAETDTLSCVVDGFDTVVELDVKHSEYRQKGDYYYGEQSQLNSVYFRVPNRFFEDYGVLSEIDCEWWEYFTKPMLVVENKNRGTASAINSLYGRNTRELPTDNYYVFMAFWDNLKSGWFGSKTEQDFLWTSNYNYYGKNYHFDFLWAADVPALTKHDDWGGFAAAFTVDSLKDFYVSGETVQKKLLEHSEKLGGEKVRDRYSKALFEDYVQDGYDMGYNRKPIKADDKMTLFVNHMKTQSMWQKIFGSDYAVTTDYFDMDAIITIDGDDLKGTNSEIANELCINARDVDSLKAEYAKAELLDETVVLFRFSTTKYFACKGAYSSCKKADINSGTSDGEILINDCYYRWKDSNWNCEIVQETVYLDFDIISLTYTNDDVETVIPVVSSPIDIFGGLDPSLDDPRENGNGDNLLLKILQAILIILVVILLVWILAATGLLPTVIHGIIWVVCLPFRLIKATVDGVKKSVDKNKKGK
ncbi:MAG: hypothetical protein K2M47_06705 [Clostridiales bacterium]|nr:hypothetical protein [Clostridiales bacterium]